MRRLSFLFPVALAMTSRVASAALVGEGGAVTFDVSAADPRARVCPLVPRPARDERCDGVPIEVDSRMAAMGPRLVAAVLVEYDRFSYTVTVERDPNPAGGELTLPLAQALAAEDRAGAEWSAADADFAVTMRGPEEAHLGAASKVFHATIAAGDRFDIYYVNAADGTFEVTFEGDDSAHAADVDRDAIEAMRTLRVTAPVRAPNPPREEGKATSDGRTGTLVGIGLVLLAVVLGASNVVMRKRKMASTPAAAGRRKRATKTKT